MDEDEAYERFLELVEAEYLDDEERTELEHLSSYYDDGPPVLGSYGDMWIDRLNQE